MVTNVVILCADSPDARGMGGVQVVTADLAHSTPESVRVLVAYPRHGALWVHEANDESPIAVFEIRLDADPLGEQEDLAGALAATLAGTGAHVLHVQNVNFAPCAMLRAASTAGIPFGITLHDHSLVCENYQLLKDGMRYCAIPDDQTECDLCLGKTHGRYAGRILDWRRTMAHVVRSCAYAIAPSRSVLDHALRMHPDLRDRAKVLPWGVPFPPTRASPSGSRAAPLRVAVVGVHAVSKGSERLEPLIRGCAHLPVEWHLFGATEGASLRHVRRAAKGVFVHGAYPRAKLASRLARARCDLVLLPSVMPEAFSLVLSEVLAAGLPVIGSDIGALGERILQDDVGWVFDPWHPAQLATLLEALERDRGRVVNAAARVHNLPIKTRAQMAEEHAELWRRTAAGVTPARSGDIAGIAAAKQAFATASRGSLRYRRSRLNSLIRRFRNTDFYRDLRIRRLLPESTRLSVERHVSRVARRIGRTR